MPPTTILRSSTIGEAVLRIRLGDSAGSWSTRGSSFEVDVSPIHNCDLVERRKERRRLNKLVPRPAYADRSPSALSIFGNRRTISVPHSAESSWAPSLPPPFKPLTAE